MVTDCSHRSRINASWYAFSSRHKGGVNILMCDGAVRFLADQIESLPGPKLGLFQALGGRSDGNAVGDF
jgi:prepilin-type processing-associated H-X9-DG protein